MKHIHKIIIIFIFVLFVNQSCNYSNSRLPRSLGKTLELLVVTNNKEQWNGRIGKSIKEYFGQIFEGLPQWEPMFDIFYIPEDAFNNIYKPNHLIFIVDIKSTLTQPIVETKEDLWATPQRVVKITAPNTDSFIQIFDKNKESIIELYQKLERKRILKFFKTAEERNSKEVLQKYFKLDLVLPSGFKIAKRIDNQFVWIRKETNLFSQGIMIFTYDYTNTNAFDLKKITQRRNLLTKLHIPGPTKNSYMKISDEVIQPISKEINFNNMYAIETRGLWDIYNDFMGGPFLSYTFVDETNNKLITLDAYVYAPNEQKRIHMKEMEAILHSVVLKKPELNN